MFFLYTISYSLFTFLHRVSVNVTTVDVSNFEKGIYFNANSV